MSGAPKVSAPDEMTGIEARAALIAVNRPSEFQQATDFHKPDCFAETRAASIAENRPFKILSPYRTRAQQIAISKNRTPSASGLERSMHLKAHKFAKARA